MHDFFNKFEWQYYLENPENLSYAKDIVAFDS